jgi:uncharacterized membrane protein YbaN (DUF454 family)
MPFHTSQYQPIDSKMTAWFLDFKCFDGLEKEYSMEDAYADRARIYVAFALFLIMGIVLVAIVDNLGI